jgi:hypothetical protein
MESGDDDVGRETHEIVKSSLQPKEQVGVSQLSHTGDCAIGQNQVVTDDGVDGKTVLIGLVRVPYR